MTDDEKLMAAIAWTDFRKDYGLAGRTSDDLVRVQHRAFLAGWDAGRHPGSQDASPLR